MGKKLPVLHQEGDIGECLIVHKLLTQVHLHSTTSMCTNDSTVGPSNAGLRPLSVPQSSPNRALYALLQPLPGCFLTSCTRGFLVGAGRKPRQRAANG